MIVIGNSTSVRGFSQQEGDAYEVFDQLPADAKRALHEANIDWCPFHFVDAILESLHAGLTFGAAVDRAAEIARRQDASELQQFGAAWPQRWGTYPALAAQATFCRYDEVARVRAGRRA